MSSYAFKFYDKIYGMTPKGKRSNRIKEYFDFFDYIASITYDPKLRALAERCKLAIVAVSWEDTARDKNSSWGPNISDVTLFAYKNGNEGTAMPMIKMGGNYEDLTVDRKAEDFMIPVGNEKDGSLTRISLSEYLTNIGKYSGNPDQKSLLDEKRDSQILTSMQYCMLPLHEGEVEFAVQLFNYQSSRDDPAVLVLVVSDEGTSAQVITSAHQKLFLNSKGRAHSFSAKRLSQDREEKGKKTTGAMDTEEKNKNYLMIFQIPLKQKPKPKRAEGSYAVYACSAGVAKCCKMQCESASFSKPKGVEYAIIKKGSDRGEFYGLKKTNSSDYSDYYNLVRDTDYPIRCTLQKYQVTDTKDISERVFAMISNDIQEVYKSGVAMGSHVVDESKEGVPERMTKPDGLDSDKAKMATVAGMEKGKEVYSDQAKNKEAGLKPMFSAFA